MVPDETVYEGAELRMSSSLEAANPMAGIRGSVRKKKMQGTNERPSEFLLIPSVHAHMLSIPHFLSSAFIIPTF